MKFCVALFFQNEADWLSLHLPKIMAAACVDGLIAVDGGSQDNSADIIREMGGTVYERPFDFTDSGQNFLIQCCEQAGFDAMLHTAPDECWFPEHIDQMKRLIESGKHKALVFPTYNFQVDRQHYAPYAPYYPDHHARVWLLEGLRYPGSNHTQIDYHRLSWQWRSDCDPSEDGRDILLCPHIHLFHYADVKPRFQRDLLAINRLRADEGQEPIDTLPEGYVVSKHPYHIEFSGVQPLDPTVIGLKAPYED